MRWRDITSGTCRQTFKSGSEVCFLVSGTVWEITELIQKHENSWETSETTDLSNSNFTEMEEDMNFKMEIEKESELKWNTFYPWYHRI